MRYTFPGLKTFIRRAAGRDLAHIDRSDGIWHCRQIEDSLKQMAVLDPVSREELMGHVLRVRGALLTTLHGIDAAVQDVRTELGMHQS